MKTLGCIGQWLGVVLFALAFVALIVSGEENLFATIVVGASFLFTLATKVRYYKGREKVKKVFRLDDLFWRNGGLYYGKARVAEKRIP